MFFCLLLIVLYSLLLLLVVLLVYIVFVSTVNSVDSFSDCMTDFGVDHCCIVKYRALELYVCFGVLSLQKTI